MLTKPFLLYATLLFLLLGCQRSNRLVTNIELNKNWSFKDSSTNKWYPANVPGTVHTDLLQNNLIKNPFKDTNEYNLQWIGERCWIYKTTFQINSKIYNRKNISLLFEGLDTFAKIYLNGNKIGVTNNMFRSWEIDVKQNLLLGENKLKIIFESAEKRAKTDSINNNYILPGGYRVYARKAGYHFGWDWGPKFITCGIWKKITLNAWDNSRINDIYVRTKSISDKKADIESIIKINTTASDYCTINIINKNTGNLIQSNKVSLKSGLNTINCPFSIQNPKLWWCNGMGEPYLYSIDFEIITKSGQKTTKTIQHGIRKIEIIATKDSIGESMFLKLNEIPVFMKGANYIPQHSFVTAVQQNDYKSIINLAIESNMNMLRVWGGGIYENDTFYNLCDKNGILVWQDFMFACAMYPADSMFLENVKKEATEQIKRLRNHPSIALWNGNNEIDEGWHNWGWQKQFKINKSDSAKIWNGYKTLFKKILPSLIEKYDPERFYSSTSPKYGWGRNKSLNYGTAHYWGVWWGLEPFTKYLDKVPRFMSEFGFQAMPTISTIRQFQSKSADTLFSPTLIAHQKHKTGYETILKYLKHEKLFPKNIADFIYMSQLIQAEGIGMAIEAHRRAKPYCMGTLYWQLNDCWPVTSWSGTDFYKNRKMLQFKVKELYKNVVISMLEHKNSIDIYLISDSLTVINGTVELFAIDFNGNKESIFKTDTTLNANQSTKIKQINTSTLFAKYNPQKTIFEARFTTDLGTNYTNRKIFYPLGSLPLPHCNIEATLEPINDGYNIKLKSDSLATFVHLSLKENHAQFSNNHLFLMPNTEMIIKCKTQSKIKRKNLIINYLNK